MEEIFRMAGVAIAHSVLSISKGESLIPILGKLNKDGETTLARQIAGDIDPKDLLKYGFTGDLEKAVEIGKEKLNSNPDLLVGAALVVDKTANLPQGNLNLLHIDVRDYRIEGAKLELIIPYEKATKERPLKIYSLGTINVENIPNNDLQNLQKGIAEGVSSHKEGFLIWVASLEKGKHPWLTNS